MTDLDAVRKNTTYISTLAHDGLTALRRASPPARASSSPTASRTLGRGSTTRRARTARRRWTSRSSCSSAPGASSAATRPRAARSSTGNNQVFKGTFAFVGPRRTSCRSRAGAGHGAAARGLALPPRNLCALLEARRGLGVFPGTAGHDRRGRLGREGAAPEGDDRLRPGAHPTREGSSPTRSSASAFLSLLMIAQKIGDLAPTCRGFAPGGAGPAWPQRLRGRGRQGGAGRQVAQGACPGALRGRAAVRR
jgi:hypothetical protein